MNRFPFFCHSHQHELIVLHGTQPYFEYKDQNQHTHQVWYDDPESLMRKYAVAAEMHLRGVGMWNVDCLDYKSTNPAVKEQTRAMWDALRRGFPLHMH